MSASVQFLSTTGFFMLKDASPIFQPTIGPNCFKFGMEVSFDISFQPTEAIFDILPQSQFMGQVCKSGESGKMGKNWDWS